MVVPGDLPDSLTGDDRVIIEAEDGENPPVFEKSVKGESGKSYFIFKRANASAASKPVLDLSVFPNPSSGKFNLKVFNPEKSDVLIRVVNESGKEVYLQLVESLKGDHSFEVDLGSRAKGKYLITATAGTRQLTRKVIVE